MRKFIQLIRMVAATLPISEEGDRVVDELMKRVRTRHSNPPRDHGVGSEMAEKHAEGDCACRWCRPPSALPDKGEH